MFQILWVLLFSKKNAFTFSNMEMNINIVQFVGIWLMVTGLIINTIVFIFSYFKVISRLKKNEDDTEGEEKEEEKKKSFPIIRMVFHFRRIIKDAMSEEKRENFELIVAFLKWILFVAVGLIAVGLVMFFIGFFF